MKKFLLFLSIGLTLSFSTAFAAETEDDKDVIVIGEDNSVEEESVSAEELSTMNFEIEKDYKEITVIITNEDGLSSAVISLPDKKEKDLEEVEGKYAVTIKNPDKGRYSIKLSAPVGSKSKLRVDAQEHDSEAQQKINNLKVYHNERDVCVEWNDVSVPSITIDVVNSVNNQVLVSESTQVFWRYSVPEQVGTVLVKVKPATLNTVSGYDETFFLDVNEDVGVYAVFDDISITNEREIKAALGGKGSYSFVVSVNRNETSYGQEEEILIPLEEGGNDIVITMTNERGNKKSFSKNVFLDTVAPVLSIASSFDGEVLNKPDYSISGYVRDFNILYLNNVDVTDSVSMDGYFKLPYELHLGLNEVAVCAVDEAGNETIYVANVTYEQKKIEPLDIIIMAVVALFVIGAIIFVIIRKKRSYIDTEEEFSEYDDEYESEEDTEESDEESEESDEEESVEDDSDDADQEEFEVYEEEEKPSKSFSIKMPSVSLPARSSSENKAEEAFDFLTFIRSNVFVLITCLICVVIIIINTCILQFGRAMSGSMEPTIKVGDIDLNARIFSTVERYDIVSFRQDSTLVGKRVIGLPGDEVSFKDGYVYINGEQLNEPYLDPEVETNCTKTFVVPENSVFLLGDNRMDSYDSRYWENPYVSISDIKSKFICVIYHK